MSAKPRAKLGYATGLGPETEALRKRMSENAYPQILRGERLQQRELPTQFLESVLETRRAEQPRVVKASNLAEVRARMRVRKPAIG